MKQNCNESAKHGLYQATIRAHHRTPYFGTHSTLLFRDPNRPAQYNGDSRLYAQQLFQSICEWLSGMVIASGGLFTGASGKSHWPIHKRFSDCGLHRHGLMVCYAYAKRPDCSFLRTLCDVYGLSLSHQDAIAGSELWAS